MHTRWGPDIEGTAEALLRAHGFPLDEPPDVEKLAWCALGASNVQYVPGLRVPGRYLPAEGVIQVRSGMSRRRRRFVVAHELGEWVEYRLRYQGEDAERIADAIAAALVVPRRAMQAAVQALGRHLPDLSDALCASQSVVALRLGEVTGSPLALVTPRNVHVRGDEWSWPGEREIRALARGELPRELERVEVTDAAWRAVLVAA